MLKRMWLLVTYLTLEHRQFQFHIIFETTEITDFSESPRAEASKEIEMFS